MIGGRLFNPELLTLYDIQNCSKLIETLAKTLQDKRSDLSKNHPKTQEQT